MKKVLSLSAMFILFTVGACSTTPDDTDNSPKTLQEVLSRLQGNWEDGDTDIIFSGNTVKIHNSTFTLDEASSVVLDNKIYAIYSNASSIAIFRPEGNQLHGDNGATLDEIKENFTRSPSSLRTPTGDREKSSTGRSIARTLAGEWRGGNGVPLIFSGRSLLTGGKTFMLSRLDSVTIGNKAYAVYLDNAENILHIFRTEGADLFSDSGSTLDDIKQRFSNNPNVLQTPIAVQVRN